MKHYDFNELIDRHGTDCIKVDMLKERFGNANLTPLWVADMDFRTPDFIVNAIRKRCEHEIFGYTFPSENYYRSVIDWVDYRHKWQIEQAWLSYIPGIVKGIAYVLDCFTQQGDKVIIQPPVYYPFRLVPEGMHRRVVNNPLKLVNGVYRMDFEQLESVIDKQCKAFILCSPHNPGGVVWDKETLVRLAELCSRHKILVISDEIHAEMVYPQYTHHPFATVSEAAASCSITFMAPSKTFNIAGIVASYAIVPNEAVRRTFFSFMEARELNAGSLFAYTATQAAYTYGADWLRQMLAYVMENVRFTADYLAREIPEVMVYVPQASFLIWLDCRTLKRNQQGLVALFKEAGLALNDGSTFGEGGEGYMRLNAGSPRRVLEQALMALKRAVDKTI
ncbi:MAG: PatB family C-S lyase [Bacteroidales bacterium]